MKQATVRNTYKTITNKINQLKQSTMSRTEGPQNVLIKLSIFK
jgi:hypothetical protein